MKNGFINNDGFSLIEALVSIVLIGILSSLILSFILKMSTGDKSITRMKAVALARNEIRNSIINSAVKDTCYSDTSAFLTLFKSVTNNDRYYDINIIIKDNKNNQLVNIPFAIKKNEDN